MTTVFLPLWNSFRSGFFEETKQKYNHFNNGRAARNGICFSSCLKLLQKHALKIQKITSTKKKEIAHEHVIEKYSFNLQFESFMVSKCVNTATFSLAMTFCHHKKFINRQHLAQITFLPRQALIHSLGSACFLSQMICNAYLQSGEEIACYFKRPSTELTLDWEEAPLTTLKFT